MSAPGAIADHLQSGDRRLLVTRSGPSLDAANSRGAPKTRPCLEFQFVGVDGSAIDAKVGGSWPVLTEIKALFEGT